MKVLFQDEVSQLVISGDLTCEQIEQQGPLPAKWFTQPLLQLELGQLQRIDSFGLAWLLEVESNQRRNNGKLQWLHCSDAVKRLLALYNLSLKQHSLVAMNNNDGVGDGTQRN